MRSSLILRATGLLMLAVVALPVAHAPAAYAAPLADCQPYSGIACAFPFPDDRFTVMDRATATGLRVHLSAAALPVPNTGIRLRVGPYDSNDGFSPGSTLVVHVPGFDDQAALDRSGAAQLGDIGASLAPGQPIEVIDTATGRPVPIWSEMGPVDEPPQSTDLIVHPAGSFTEGDTYIAVLRGLQTDAGTPIPSPRWFAAMRSGRHLTRFQRPGYPREAAILAYLRRHGVAPASLYEAWEFTVGSRRSLTQRMIGIRDEAFADLGDPDLRTHAVTGSAPAYSIQGVTPLSSATEEVQGTIEVPCFLTSCTLTSDGGFHYSTRGINAIPTQLPGQFVAAPFDCVVPTDASPAAPARVSLYGHGFLGTPDEVAALSQQQLASRLDMVLCSTAWLGLAQGDIGNDIDAMLNPNLLPAQVDRMQQGVLDMLYLGRLMVSPTGLSADPDFQQGGQSILDTQQLYYDGNSTGGIEGGIVAAVSPDVTRAVLGVSSIDWANWLIPRTQGIGGFEQENEQTFPDPSATPLMLDLMQQLWDRGDPDGYVADLLTDRLPGTRPHQVLMQTGYGDPYVSMYSAVAEARTIGIPDYQPALDPDRVADDNLLWGLPVVPGSPYAGSAFEMWDSGPGAAPAPSQLDEQPPATPPALGEDPHELVRYTPAAQEQISDFLSPQGAFVDVCGGLPCHTVDYLP